MGLDMYLYKKTYVKNWNHTPKEDKFSITIKKGGKKFEGIKTDRISGITEQVGYWRKFNALHSWFVQNCANGVDDCKEMYVEKEKIKELLITLHEVKLKLDKCPMKMSKIHTGWSDGERTYDDWEVYDIDSTDIEDLLPTTAGFFFGNTEYDKYYYEEVCNSIDLFENLLKEIDDCASTSDIYYEASW